MREKLNRFMQGRYGNDRLNQFLMVAALVCIVLSFIWGGVFDLIALLLMIYAYYRMLSRNMYQRAAENQWYLRKEQKVKGFFGKQKNVFQQRKTHHIYKCPNCKQKIRVPKGKGRIAIRCQKCGTEFIRRS